MSIDYASIDDLVRAHRTRNAYLGIGLVAVSVFVFGVAGAVFHLTNLPEGIITRIAIAAGLIVVMPFLIWNNPKIGLYVLFGAAMLFEGTTNGGSQTATIPTTFVPFFWNLNNLGRQYGTEALGPLKFSFAEVLMVITFLAWIVRTIALREFKFERGAFFGFFAAYLSMVIVGWFRGVATNADIGMALWEVRSQFHF